MNKKKRCRGRKVTKKEKNENEKKKEGLVSEVGLKIERKVSDSEDTKANDVENTEPNVGLQNNEQKWKVNDQISIKKDDSITEENVVMQIVNHVEKDIELKCNASGKSMDKKKDPEGIILQRKTLETLKEEPQSVSQNQKYFEKIISYGAFGCGLDIIVDEIREDITYNRLCNEVSENDKSSILFVTSDTVNETKSPKRKCKEVNDEDIREPKRTRYANQFQNLVNIEDYISKINSPCTGIMNASINTYMNEPYYTTVENGKIVEYSSYEQHCLHVFEELFDWNDTMVNTTPQWLLDEINEATSEIHVNEEFNNTPCDSIDLLVAETCDNFGEAILTYSQGVFIDETCLHKSFRKGVQCAYKNGLSEFHSKMENLDSIDLERAKDEIDFQINISESSLETFFSTISDIQIDVEDFTNTTASPHNIGGSIDGESTCAIEQEYSGDNFLNTDKSKLKTMAKIEELRFEQKYENNYSDTFMGLNTEKNTTQEIASLEGTEDSNKSILKEISLQQCNKEAQINSGDQKNIQKLTESGKINSASQSDKRLEMLQDRKTFTTKPEIEHNNLNTIKTSKCDEYRSYTYGYEGSQILGYKSKEKEHQGYNLSVSEQNVKRLESKPGVHNYHENRKLNLLRGNGNNLPQLKTQMLFLNEGVNEPIHIHSDLSENQERNGKSELQKKTQKGFIEEESNIFPKNTEITSTENALKDQNKTLKNYFEEFQESVQETDKNKMPVACVRSGMSHTTILQTNPDKSRGFSNTLNGQPIAYYNPNVNSTSHRNRQQLFVLPDGRKVPAEEPIVKEFYIDFLKHNPPQIHIPSPPVSSSLIQPERKCGNFVRPPVGHSQSWDMTLRMSADSIPNEQRRHLVAGGGFGSGAQSSYVQDTLRRIFRKEKEVWVCVLCGKKLCSRSSLLRHEKTLHLTGNWSADKTIQGPLSLQFPPETSTQAPMSSPSLNQPTASSPMPLDTRVPADRKDVFKVNEGTTSSSTNTWPMRVRSESSNTRQSSASATKDETVSPRNKSEPMPSQGHTATSSSFTDSSHYPRPLAIPHDSLVKKHLKLRVPTSPFFRYPSRPSPELNTSLSHTLIRSKNHMSPSPFRPVSTTLQTGAALPLPGRPPLRSKHVIFTPNSSTATSQGFLPWSRSSTPTSSEILRPIMYNSKMPSSNVSASSAIVISDLSLNVLRTGYCAETQAGGNPLRHSQYSPFPQMLTRHPLAGFSSGSSMTSPGDCVKRAPLSVPGESMTSLDEWKYCCHICGHKYKFEVHFAKHMSRHGRQMQH